jgi:hypothetical protein
VLPISSGYIRTIKSFAVFLDRSPDTASFEDVRRFLLHLAESGADTPALNHTVSALRFFFRVRSPLKPGPGAAQLKSKMRKLWTLPSGPPALLDRAKDSVRHRYGSPPDNLGSGGSPFSEKMTGRLTFRTEPGSN